MKMRFAVGATAATAIMLLSACGDDDSTTTTEAADPGPTTLAKGEDIELVGGFGLGAQTLNIDAEQGNGEVTGEVRMTGPDGELVVTIECADTDTDSEVVLGGTITQPADEPTMSGRFALIIREGSPDTVTGWIEEPDPESGELATSCAEFLETLPAAATDESAFVEVEPGGDIETG
jgi:hypothetical protein